MTMKPVLPVPHITEFKSEAMEWMGSDTLLMLIDEKSESRNGSGTKPRISSLALDGITAEVEQWMRSMGVYHKLCS